MLASTEFNQLLKIPALFNHYQEHKSQDAQMCFLKYLYLHYGTDHADNGDADKDARLPFKSFQLTLQLVAGKVSVGDIFQISPDFNICTEQIFGIYVEAFPSRLSLSSIWQPPRV
jgi:hypothetical protein